MWEYKILEYGYRKNKEKDFSKILNDFGKERWELISSTIKGNIFIINDNIDITTFICIFKRNIINS